MTRLLRWLNARRDEIGVGVVVGVILIVLAGLGGIIGAGILSKRFREGLTHGVEWLASGTEIPYVVLIAGGLLLAALVFALLQRRVSDVRVSATESGSRHRSTGEAQAADGMRQTGEFEIYCDSSGNWEWRLKAPNNEIIATSAGPYMSRAACLRAVEQVQASVRSAPGNAEHRSA